MFLFQYKVTLTLSYPSQVVLTYWYIIDIAMTTCMEIRQPPLKNQKIATDTFFQMDKDREIRIM